MILKTTDWKVRLYLWSLEYRANFHNKYYREPYQTNLCEFVRGIVLWLPLTLLTQFLAIGMTVMALIIYPMMRLGFDFWKVGAWTLGLPAAFIALVAALMWLWRKIFDKTVLSERDDMSWSERLEQEERKRAEFASSLLGLCIAWVKATKAEICPIINLEK